MRNLLTIALLLAGAACDSADRTARVHWIESEVSRRAPALRRSEASGIARALVDAEDRWGVDAFLLAAVADVESSWRPNARGPRGAMGLMQFRPATAHDVAQRHGIPLRGKHALDDPRTSIRLAAAYLSELQESFSSWEIALAAYNAGPTRVRSLVKRNKKPPTRYAARVMRRYRELEQRWQEDAP